MRHHFDSYTLTCERCDRGVDTLYDCEKPKRIQVYKYRPKPPKPRPPKKPRFKLDKNAWYTCAFCPPEDAEWPGSAFTAGGSAFRYRKRICNSCFKDRYERIDVRCACGKVTRNSWKRRSSTHKTICRDCRKAQKT